MTDFLREWVMGVAAAALMCTAAMAMTPKSRVRGVLRMCCAAALCCALLAPLSSAPLDAYADSLARLREAQLSAAETGTDSAERLERTIIESECAAYISDKGAQLGLPDAGVRVLAKWGDGYWYPYEVWLDIPKSDELMISIEGELGVPRERMHWNDGEGET